MNVHDWVKVLPGYIMSQADENLAMMWSHIPHGQSLQDFAEDGVAYFKRKFGYSPTKIEYRVEDGEINISGILCVSKSSGIQRKVVLIYPAEPRV